MNILLVVQFFSPKDGGSVLSTYELAKQLNRKGHEVNILTTDYQIDQDFVQSLEGVKVLQFHCIANIGNFLLSPSINEYLNINLHTFDIIHMNNFRTYQNIMVHKYAKKYGIPYILQPRGTVPTISKSKQKKIFDMFFGYDIIKDASKIIASSKIESDQYWDVFSEIKYEKIIHIPNGIDLELYNNLPKKGEFKRKYSININNKIILFLSRIHERKGADTLVEVFSKLKNEFVNIKLVVAGPDEGFLNKLKILVKKLNIENDILFPGPLYGRDKLEAYVDADVFILPSKNRYESFGNVVLEALACGTPIIVTNNCGVSEWINNDVGYIVEYDKNQFQNNIVNILKDEKLRDKIGEEGRRFVIEKFGWDKIIEKIEDVYTSTINASQR